MPYCFVIFVLMERKILLVVFNVFFSVLLFSQSTDSLLVAKAIGHVKDNLVLQKAIKKSLHKDAVNFAVSENIVDNYRPLLYFQYLLSDSLKYSDTYIDSITRKIPADHVTKIKWAPTLSVKKDSKYTLYCSKPLDDLVLVILEYDGAYNPRRKYMGIGRQPFMVLMRLRADGSIRECFYGCWIVE